MDQFGGELPESMRKFLKTDINRLIEIAHQYSSLQGVIIDYALKRSIPTIPLVDRQLDRIEYGQRDAILKALELINDAGYDLCLEIISGSKIYRQAFLMSVDYPVELDDNTITIMLKDDEDDGVEGFPVLDIDLIDKLIVHLPRDIGE